MSFKDDLYTFDIETFSNLFTVVFKKWEEKKDIRFVIHESRNDYEELIDWLQSNKPTLVGYNSLNFDAQVIEHMMRGHVKNAEDIYAFSQQTIERLKEDRFDTEYSEWDLSLLHIDLFKLNHYDRGARFTSLKWLEFTMRYPKMRDMPYSHYDVIPKSGINKVLAYNANDVKVTEEFLSRCMQMVEFRYDMYKKHKTWRIMSMSDTSIATYVGKKEIAKKLGVKAHSLKWGTMRNEVAIKDCIAPYIEFDTDVFNDVLDYFNQVTLNKNPKTGELKTKGIIKYEAEMFGVHYDFGLGGLHGCTESGVYKSTDDRVILSVDVKSYYPNLGIKNKFYPEHIGEAFCNINQEWFDTRATYEKGTADNYAYKIMLNSSYGQTKSRYSYLYDPKYTMSITITGQLSLAMLAEKLAMVGDILMVNTDGLEVMIPRNMKDVAMNICSEWEQITNGLELEYDEYSKLVIRDVNNYIAINSEGKVKRKGFFEIYEDITEQGGKPHSYHKNPSAAIIPLALNNYYVHGTPVDKTILEHDNIHDFLLAIKGKKDFDYLFMRADDYGVIDINKRSDRVLRYYIANDGFNIFKMFKDGREAAIQAVNKGQLISLLTDVNDIDPKNYDDLDYTYYISEVNETINEITQENGG